jgi:hypothetical protein
MHVNFQRGKDRDEDMATFVVKVGDQIFGPLSGTLPNSLGSGDTISFADFAPDHPDGARSWEIGPINISDGDLVSVGYSIINTSDHADTGQLTVGDEIKITAAWVGGWTSVTGAVIAATAPATAGATAVVGVIVAGVGAVVAFLGELLGDLFGHDAHCNGTVLSDKEDFSGSQLSQMAGSLQFGDAHTITIKYDNPDSPRECGHPPQTLLAWSIINQTVPAFGSDVPLLPTQPPSPMIGSQPQHWVGSWGENDFLEDSHVNVRVIELPGNTQASAGPRQTPLEIKGFVSSLRHQIGADPRGFRPPLPSQPTAIGLGETLSAFAPTSTNATALNHLFSVARQQVFITERDRPGTGGVLVQIDGAEGWHVPMFAPPYTRDFFNLPTNSEVAGPSLQSSAGTSHSSIELNVTPGVLKGAAASSVIGVPHGTVAQHQSSTVHSAIGQKPAPISSHPVALPFADSLLLSDRITLQLYGEFSASHVLIRRRLRYLRTQANGRVISDVMLRFSQPRPK